MILPARVTDPDGYPGVAVRVVSLDNGDRHVQHGFEVVGPDNIIRTFSPFGLREGWPEEKSPYESFLNGFR